MSIAGERIASIADKLARHKGQVGEVAVLLLGDLVEGVDIYPSQIADSEANVFDQVRSCTSALWSLLLALRDVAPVTATGVPGNHGMASRRDSPRANWDSVVLWVLAELAAAGEHGVSVSPQYNTLTIVEIAGHRYLLDHRGIKHAGTKHRLHDLASQTTAHSAEAWLHGHWHSVSLADWQGRPVVGNGCLCGSDDLSERMALYSSPAQVHFLAHRGGQAIADMSWIAW
jgi:hypothetical protein